MNCLSCILFVQLIEWRKQRDFARTVFIFDRDDEYDESKSTICYGGASLWVFTSVHFVQPLIL